MFKAFESLIVRDIFLHYQPLIERNIRKKFECFSQYVMSLGIGIDFIPRGIRRYAAPFDLTFPQPLKRLSPLPLPMGEGRGT